MKFASSIVALLLPSSAYFEYASVGRRLFGASTEGEFDYWPHF